MKKHPHLAKLNGIDTLFVQEEPFLVLAGELHNSSASSLDYMDAHVWPNLRELNLNTVLLPVCWEQIEPSEDTFDFTLIDGIIQRAREKRLHLVLLWFGLWKNSESTYVPRWIKADTKTYFRAKKITGETINTISPLCALAVEKDANALGHLMAHLRDFDQQDQTVIMIQVENEIGLLGTDRDYSEPGEAAFRQTVPAEVEAGLNVAGTWPEAFGYDAAEQFMAYHFAKAVEKITRAAQTSYPLPCYTNAWLKQYPWYPGSYPSGGPVRDVHSIWKLAAPSLFTLAPDIYVPYVPTVLDEYSYSGNPLFVPEVRKDAVTASYALYAFGACNAIGYSPFGIEELALDPAAIDKPPLSLMVALNIDPSAFEIEGSKAYLAKTNQLIEQLKPQLLQFRGTKHLQSFVKKSDVDFGTLLKFENYDLQVAYHPKEPSKPVAAGIVFELEANRFLILGMMCSVTIRPKRGENARVEYLQFTEGDWIDGKWQPGRQLNGDERMSITFKDMPRCYILELCKQFE